MFYKPYCIGVLCLLCAAGAYAEEAAQGRQQLDDVVVTATRTERKTEEVAAGVSVVGKEEIQNSRMFGIKEALTGLSGVQSETKNGGYDSRLIIRGAGLKARYGVREIMVLLDGVPITDPDGLSRFDFIDTQLVERIDVVKGPNSTMYGANAAGGVVNIISRNPFEEIKSLKIGYGSENTQMYNLIYGTSFGSTYVTVAGSRKSTDSWRAWNKFDTSQTSLKIGHLLDEKTSIDFNFSYTDANIQLPGTLTKSQFDSDISQLTSEPWRHSGRYSEIYFTNLKLEKEIGDFKLKPLVYFQHWQHYHPVTGAINDGSADIYGSDIQVDWKHHLLGLPGVLTSGVSAQVDTPNGKKYTFRDVRTLPTGRITATLSDASGSLMQSDDDTVAKWGVYAQESLQPSQSWIVDIGVRFDQVRFDLSSDLFQEFDYASGRYVANRQQIGVDKAFNYVSPRIGAVYKVNDSLNLYGTIATGFQTPQSSELSDNPNLDPATTINYEVGAKSRFSGGHSIDLSLFYMDVSDEIVQTYLVGGATTYSNAGSTIKKGIELSGKYQALTSLYLGGTYTYSDFSYDSFQEPVQGQLLNRSGNRLPYIPEHQYNLYAFYKHPSGFKAKLDTYSWGSYFVDNANSEKYDGYEFLTNLLVGYEDKHWDITFDVNNLFDKHYAMEVTKDTATRYRPGAPITYFGKISYKF
ncbi:TonB-dependent receptor [Geobacter pelophilus]|uniref:TonB-dependent receptor n=1 Tax=Geoanaerobacter pelophilus TaxID=60036 RepID=A0AAW4L8U8_9BACT|nr:TonB-dependent receptor [Geoanaerobacter pelophilus]